MFYINNNYVVNPYSFLSFCSNSYESKAMKEQKVTSIIKKHKEVTFILCVKTKEMYRIYEK